MPYLLLLAAIVCMIMAVLEGCGKAVKWVMEQDYKRQIQDAQAIVNQWLGQCHLVIFHNTDYVVTDTRGLKLTELNYDFRFPTYAQALDYALGEATQRLSPSPWKPLSEVLIRPDET